MVAQHRLLEGEDVAWRASCMLEHKPRRPLSGLDRVSSSKLVNSGGPTTSGVRTTRVVCSYHMVARDISFRHDSYASCNLSFVPSPPLTVLQPWDTNL